MSVCARSSPALFSVQLTFKSSGFTVYLRLKFWLVRFPTSSVMSAQVFHHVVNQPRELICLKINLFVLTNCFLARLFLQVEGSRKAEVEGETPLSEAAWP